MIPTATPSAKAYFFSSSDGDDSRTAQQAHNPLTPWKSIAKLNSVASTLAPGDSVLFKRGDTFTGTITASKSGTSALPITYGAYGNGANPVLSGFSSVTGWLSAGTHIWEGPVPGAPASISVVLLNGQLQWMGRYPRLTGPNGGYRTITSHPTSLSITDAGLSSKPNWVGGEIVMRMVHWSTNRSKITSHSGNTIGFAANDSGFPIVNGTGYFIQNHPSTLAQTGDWYYRSGKVGIYSPSQPTDVKVSSQAVLMSLANANYLTIRDLTFEGANDKAISAETSSNILITGNTFNFSGNLAIYFHYSGSITITHNTFHDSLNDAIQIHSPHHNNFVVSDNQLYRTGIRLGTIPLNGRGNSNHAIDVDGQANLAIERNQVSETGYIPIRFAGDHVLVKNNVIDTFNTVLDDGAAIYTYNGTTGVVPQSNDRKIVSNIISNGIGAPSGTASGASQSNGIYLDNNANHVDVLDNTVFNIANKGCHNNSVQNVTYTGNTFYNIGIGMSFARWVNDGTSVNGGQNIVGVNVQRNLFFGTGNTTATFVYTDMGVNFPSASSIQRNLSSMGTINNNYYHILNPLDFSYSYRLLNGSPWVYPSPLSLAQWRAYSGYDAASVQIPPVPAYTITGLTSANLYPDGNFVSSVTGVSSYSSPANHKVTWDNTSKIDGTGSMKISVLANPDQPTSVIQTYAPIGAVSSTKNYILRFSTRGTTENGRVDVRLRKTASPYTGLSSTQSRPYGTARVDHEFLITAPQSDAGASWEITILQAGGTTYVDNVQVYEASTAPVQLSDRVRFEYNSTDTAKTVSLDAAYHDAYGKSYSGSLTLAPYSSVVLMK